MSNELAYISSGASSNHQNSPTHPEGIQMQEGLGVCYVRKVSKIHSSFPPFPDILSETLLSFSVVPTPVSVEDTDLSCDK